MHRADRRRAEETLAQLTARRHALEELERDRVGLAPAAAALLAARERFGGGILGPLSDFVSTSRDDAELAERLLGEWMHAVLVRDEATADAVRAWHAEHQPGALVLLPLEPGPGRPRRRAAPRRTPAGCRARGGVGAGRARGVSRYSTTPAGSSGAPAGPSSSRGAGTPSGPLRRRAELASLEQDVDQGATCWPPRTPR